MTERRDQRTRDRSQSRFAPLIRKTNEVFGPSSDYCHCVTPITDLDLSDLESDETEWCWRCRRPIAEPTVIQRLVTAFLA